MNIPTAEEFWNSKKGGFLLIEDAMIEFAKLHVQTALEKASEIANYGIYQNDDGQEPFHHESNIFVNKNEILNAYPLENIK